MRLGVLQLRRARRRSTALVLAITVLTLLVLVVSTISTTLLRSLAGAIATMDADVLVLTTASQGTVQASRIGPDVADSIQAVPGVHRVAAVGETRITARVDGRDLDASLFGIPAEGPGRPGHLVAGRLPDAAHEVVVDDADLRRGLDLGTTIAVQGTDVVLEVVGLTTGGRFGGIATLYAPYATWEQVFGQLFPKATELRPSVLAVDAVPSTDPAVLAEAITATVAGATARTSPDAALALPGIAGIRDSFRLIGVIAAASTLLLVGSFWALTTAQQATTLAVLRAAGIATRRLLAALITQVVIVVGAGVALASAALWFAGLRAPPTFPLQPDPGEVMQIGSVLLLAAVGAALPAMLRIARTDPVEALAKADR